MSALIGPLSVVKPIHGGVCLAFDDEGTVMISHAIPGEVVRARVTRRKGRIRWAEATEILEASPDRRAQVWPEAGVGGVGGAELGHVTLPASRRWKADVIADALSRVGSRQLAEEVGDITVTAAPGDDEREGLHWRSRVELTVAADGTAGMHAAASHDVLPIADMPLAASDVLDLNLLGADSPWRELWQPGQRVRAWAGHVRVDDAWFDAGRRPVDEPTLALDVDGDTYAVRGGDFWQAHRLGAAVLRRDVIEAARGWADGGVLELYCGSGLFTRPLAELADTAAVLAVEGSESACAQAAVNLPDGANAEVECARITGSYVASLAEPGEGPALVVLDPPRQGAGAFVTRALVAMAPDRVVYVACDPAALARDGEVLRQGGYRITQLQCHDLFPYTHHVECVGVWDRLS
ncbi:MAG: class I SAM-dependent RNA methyltransferase [Actinomycetaceae bacterium]|nr:class I SAM-dependent RNA methyltransferase [Actinomycetaceae bacterium]MDU0969416.1 class I SAM-dependent RNA methyltransferase [Actinomycetaceae bacterium]